MRYEEKEIQKILDQSLTVYRDVPQEDVNSAVDRAWERVRSAPAVEERTAVLSRRLHWPAAAAIAAAIALAVFLPTRIAQSAPAMLEDANGSRKIQYGEVVRPSGDKSATLSMADGSRVEARPQSEFLLERTEDGDTRIRLNRGGVTVVAAVRGEVRVQQGATEVRLRPGEQLTSKPKVERLSFEEAVIRPSLAAQAAGGGARGGGEGAVDCMHRGQLDRRRLFIGHVSLYELVGLAYAYCADGFSKFNPVVLTGPAWIKSARWDIEALIPDGTVDPLPTGFNGPAFELWDGRSPRVQKMLQTLLEERFKVVVRRDAKETSADVLTVAPGGPQFQNKSPGQAFFSDFDRKPVSTEDGAAASRISFAARCEGNPCHRAAYWNMPMTAVVKDVGGMTGRPVIDRTGIQGTVTFALEWPRDPSISGGDLIFMTHDRRAFAKAFELIGLKFEEDPKARVEIFVIESAEKP